MVPDKWLKQSEMLVNRVKKNQRHLRKWLKRENVSCYRLYEKDIPEVPLVIDWYQGRLHVAEFVRFDESEHGEEKSMWLEVIAEGLCEGLELDRGDVFIKQRQRQKGKQQYERVSEEEHRFIAKEGGLQFWVNLSDYLDTGLFLDHRAARGMVREEAAGKHFLNLFAYTGSFSVYAEDGGASHSTTVDMSKTYVNWTEDNFRLNDMDLEKHKLVQADVFAFLQDDSAHSEPYDLVVLDPPTFSNSKRMQDVLDVQRDHPWLIQQVLQRMNTGGVLYFSNNFRKFKLDIGNIEGIEGEELSHKTVPRDFRNRQIHRCWRFVKTG